jgi:hypothetical protein
MPIDFDGLTVPETFLKAYDNRLVSVFIRCAISVYGIPYGRIYIGTIHAGLPGKVSAGTVAVILGETLAAEQIAFASLN